MANTLIELIEYDIHHHEVELERLRIALGVVTRLQGTQAGGVAADMEGRPESVVTHTLKPTVKAKTAKKTRTSHSDTRDRIIKLMGDGVPRTANAIVTELNANGEEKQTVYRTLARFAVTRVLTKENGAYAMPLISKVKVA
jgi:hypothetical protein